MTTRAPLCCSFFFAVIVLLEVCNAATNPWLDYMVTVEQPVTLVTHSEAIRHNGTCCNPADPTDCIICPDDPSVQFTLQVCFRTGYRVGIGDISDCPLGRLDRPPNSTPGPWLQLTPRPEAATLSRKYPGSVQPYVRIVATVDGEEVHLDDVWVFGVEIPADNVFRRITALSFKGIAIVGVNVRVMCTNDCSEDSTTAAETSTTTAETSATAAETTAPETSATAAEITTGAAETTTTSSQPTNPPSDITTISAGTHIAQGTEALSSTISTLSIGLFVGAIAAVMITLLLCIICTCCVCRKNSANKMRTQADLNLMVISSNPGYLTKQRSALPTMGIYDEIVSGCEPDEGEPDEGEPVPVYQEVQEIMDSKNTSSSHANNATHTT